MTMSWWYATLGIGAGAIGVGYIAMMPDPQLFGHVLLGVGLTLTAIAVVRAFQGEAEVVA